MVSHFFVDVGYEQNTRTEWVAEVLRAEAGPRGLSEAK